MKYKRIVIKLGTSVLTGGSDHLDRAHMVELVRQCAILHEEGYELLVVTSGAIAAGRARLGPKDQSPNIALKQMLAAVGQSRLINIWGQFFDIYSIEVGQVLLTRSDVHDRRRFLNARDTLQALLDHRIVPVINENDAVATSEIRVGDNDNLSALVCLLADADMLVLLTDQRGLFTADPRTDPAAELIPEVQNIDEELKRLAGGSVSGVGVGGMTTKLQAANIARRAGAEVVIAAGRARDVILRIAAGEAVGTRFLPLSTPLEGRKQWIFAGKKPAGQIVIDKGAADALRQKGSSLLAAGITSVTGDFDRGETIIIEYPRHKEFARGISRYASGELTQIAGSRSDRISEILGYTYGPVIIHRDDLILS